MKDGRRDLWIAAGIAGGSLVLYMALAGSLDFKVPTPRMASEDAWMRVASTLGGMAVIAVSGLLAYISYKRLQAAAGVASVAVFLVGLTMLGTTTGIPRILTPFLALIQAFAGFLNGLGRAAGDIGSGYGSILQAVADVVDAIIFWD